MADLERSIVNDRITHLSRLDQEVFVDVVCANLHAGAPAETWTALLDRQLIRRTGAAIRELGRDLQETTVEQKATCSAGAYADWWRRVGEPAKAELTARREQTREASRQLEAARAEDRRLAALFAAAIARHRAACAVAGLAAEPHDEALWALLDAAVVSCGSEKVTPAELLASGAWRGDGAA